MRIFAVVVATVMAVLNLAFHLVYGSSFWFTVLCVTISWVGFASLTLALDYGFKMVFGYADPPHFSSAPQSSRRLDLASRPDDDEFFR